MDPARAVVEAVAEPPGPGELEGDEGNEDPEAVFGFVDAVIALCELDGDGVAQGSADDGAEGGADNCEDVNMRARINLPSLYPQGARLMSPI